MVRRKVEFIQGEYYHIYNRGCNREPTFRRDENYYFLLRRVKREIARCAYRHRYGPKVRYNNVGFRCVRGSQ